MIKTEGLTHIHLMVRTLERYRALGAAHPRISSTQKETPGNPRGAIVLPCLSTSCLV